MQIPDEQEVELQEIHLKWAMIDLLNRCMKTRAGMEGDVKADKMHM